MDLRLSEEVAGANLGDARLDRRYGILLDRLMERPDASLPKALTVGELESAYRFVNNQRVTLPGLLAPHVEETARRCGERRDVIVSHDTTEVQYTGEQRQGLGRLRTKGRGFYLHVALAIGARERDPLGIVAARTLVRGEKRPKERGTTRRSAPDKESRRWWEQVHEVESRLGVGQAIHVADREADAYEFMAEVASKGGRFVVRLRHDRRIEHAGEPAKLEEALQGAHVVAEREVELSPRKLAAAPIARKMHPPRKGRNAKLEISATTVRFLKPRETPADWPSVLPLNVVNVVEIGAPDDCEAVSWTLATTEPVNTPEEILAIVDNYRSRWIVEEYFKALKTGCSLEKRQNESLHALLNVLGLYIPVAWLMLRLRLLSRAAAPMPAEHVLSDVQISILQAHPRTSRLMGPQPTTKTALLAVAALGGHLKQNGEPGWQTIARGFQDLLLLANGWLLNQAARSDR